MNPTVAIVRLPDVASKKGFQQSTSRITPPTAQYTTISENQFQVANNTHFLSRLTCILFPPLEKQEIQRRIQGIFLQTVQF